MSQAGRSSLHRYGVGLLTAGLTCGLAAWFHKVFDPGAFLILLSAVIISAWYGGVGPGLVATFLGGITYAYFFTDPLYTLQLRDVTDRWRLVIFLSLAALLSSLIERLHQTQQAVETHAKELQAKEEQARNAQHWLERVFDLQPTPTLFIELGTGKVTFSNRAAREMAGGALPVDPVSAPSGVPPGSFRADGRPISTEEMPNVRVARGEQLEQLELSWELPVGCRTILLHGEPLPPAYGRPASGVLMYQDVTRLKEIEAELRRHNRAKDEFLALLGHELRNPLAPMLNALALIRRCGPLPKGALDARDLCERQVRHLTRLVDDLLDVSRVANGQLDLYLEVVDLRAIAVQAVESCQCYLTEHKHNLEMDLPPAPVMVQVDALRMEQALFNILNNAAKYTPEGGRIWLTVEQSENIASVRVRDNGAGISPQLIEHVFEPFIQGRRSLARSEGGLGIGLTLVRNLMELHGGEVKATSPGVGQGSEFSIHLPACPIPTKPAVESQGLRLRRSDGPPLRILVVDDNQDAARSLALFLRLSGHEVSVAHDGIAALEVADTGPLDVVLLDVGLPGMNGYEVARRLRLRPAIDDPLLIAVTGYGQEQDRRQALAAGFDHHLVKPVDPAELERLITEANEQRRAVRA